MTQVAEAPQKEKTIKIERSKHELLGKEKDEVIEPEIEISPELFESHNYVVLYFDNDLDWQTATEVFDLKTVKRKNERIGDKGLGSVVAGSEILKTLL